MGGWVDPTAGLDKMENRKFLTLPGLELRTIRFEKKVAINISQALLLQLDLLNNEHKHVCGFF
jgi:hypothetical protein